MLDGGSRTLHNIRILLVEDHIMVRQSIRAFLESSGMEVIAETGSGREAIQLAIELSPQLILMDIHLPDMNGIEATRQIRNLNRKTLIIALTAYRERAYQRAMMDAGASAFVAKTAELEELVTIITKVLAQGDDDLLIKPGTVSDEVYLTERELEVLRCAARGWINKQIGGYLNISSRTVQVHLQAVYQKLGVSTRTEAAARALTLGIIGIMSEDET